MFTVMAAIREGLRARYAEPHRAYHGQAHIDALLAASRGLIDRLRDPVAVELAIWFHDAIYDPAATDNEARSAALLRSQLAPCAAPALIEAAALLVELTAAHAVPESVPAELRDDAAWFLDLDMAVLGAAAPEFDRYEQGIAAEYRPVHGADAYRAGRAAFLRSALTRPRLFLTQHFHAMLDAQARDNMRRALDSL